MEKFQIDNVAAIENPTESTKVLGHLCWYSVGENLYEREVLRKAMVNSGLEERFLPNPVRPVDAYRRATKDIERHKVEVGEGVYENYLIRNVASDKDFVQRNIVKEIRDTKGRKLSHSTVAELVFDRKEEKFEIKKAEVGMAEDLADEAAELYEKYLSHHNANTVRASIHTILRTLAPTPVRPSGGVYFVPIKHQKQLDAMVRYLQTLDRCEGYKIPLVNSDDNKDMVRTKLAEHLSKTLNECNDVLKNPNVQKGQVKFMIDDARRIVTQFKDYKEIITGSIDDMENQIDLIRQQVQLMLDKAK